MKLRELEERLLEDPRVRDGYENSSAIAKAGMLLRRLRERNGLTQRQLETLSGVQQAEISRMEAGQGARGITISQLETIAHAQDAEVVIAFVQKGTPAVHDAIKIDGHTVILHTVI